MTNAKAKRAGKSDAVQAAADVLYEGGRVSELRTQPGQLGADEALINAYGLDRAAQRFGLSKSGTLAFSRACADYNRAYDAEICRILAAGER